MAASGLPPTHRALVQEQYAAPLVLKTLPTPQPTAGAAVIRVLHAPIISYMRDVYNGKRTYNYVTPLVPGTSAIGRIAAVGPDSVLLSEGDLVYFDCTVRGRDDASAIFLMGLSEGGSEGSRKLMGGEWKDATFAEFAKVPLENVFRLDERRLCGSPAEGGLGYRPEQLCWLLKALVPYGGLRSINLQPGETVIVAPATGGFGSAGVIVALAMGARVIAMGRSSENLAKLKALNPDRVETVPITGSVETEVAALKAVSGRIDAFLDISPFVATESTHFKAAIVSLRHSGRVSLMGGQRDDVKIPLRFIMRNDILLKGKWMYSREDNFALLAMLTAGILDVRNLAKVVGPFTLEDWEKAFDVAFEADSLAEVVLFNP